MRINIYKKYFFICNKTMSKKEVEGIILILSCQKHLKTRIKKFKLNKTNYDGWEVIYVIGDFFLNKEYELRDNNFLYVKCEDSYIHLLKKLSLSIKFVNKIFKIKQGILRCGDDLIFNEKNLLEFLNSKKYDFYGKAYCNKDYYSENIDLLKNIAPDKFMINYYRGHRQDFSNPHHNLNTMTLKKLEKYIMRPKIWGPAGVIYYLSNKTSKILVDHMENIDFNIFHLDPFTNSYPYTIEDVGVTFIMYYNKIKFTNFRDFFGTHNSIVTHTNEFK